MRVRPFFWGLLACVCVGLLALAATVQMPVAAELHIQLTQHPTPETPLVLRVQVTDAQGVTVDNAQVLSQAWMTNMQMTTRMVSSAPEGAGMYLVQLTLFMQGPWMVTLAMRATGFVPLHQTILVQVPPQASLACLVEVSS